MRVANLSSHFPREVLEINYSDGSTRIARECRNCRSFELQGCCLYKAGCCRREEAVIFFRELGVEAFQEKIETEAGEEDKGLFCPYFNTKGRN